MKGQPTVFAPGPKVRRLNDIACLQLSRTSAGARTLHDPIASWRCSTAANHRIQPRPLVNKRSQYCHTAPVSKPSIVMSMSGFVSAQTNMDPTLQPNDRPNMVPLHANIIPTAQHAWNIPSTGMSVFASNGSTQSNSPLSGLLHSQASSSLSSNASSDTEEPSEQRHLSLSLSQPARLASSSLSPAKFSPSSSSSVWHQVTGSRLIYSKRPKAEVSRPVSTAGLYGKTSLTPPKSTQNYIGMDSSPVAGACVSSAIYRTPPSDVEATATSTNTASKSRINTSSSAKKSLFHDSNTTVEDGTVKRLKLDINDDDSGAISNQALQSTVYNLVGCSDIYELSGIFDDEMEPISENVQSTVYGLDGCSDKELLDIMDDDPFPGPDYFDPLPSEVIENILSRLPFADLFLNVNRVCKNWNYMIKNTEFMPWKKLYHRLLKGFEEAKEEIIAHMRDNGMTATKLYLPSLIRMMKDYKKETGRVMLESLSQHSKYIAAVDIIKERLPDCMYDEQTPRSWCVVTVLVLLSERVVDILEIFKCLLTGVLSRCNAPEVVDCLYCVAAFLLHFKSYEYKEIWTDSHRLQADVRMTHEQLRICKYDVPEGEVLKIVAFAGTGKTTTLLEYTRMRPDKQFLLIVFNRSVCEYANASFPHNVECCTAHRLAYRSVGSKYVKKLKGRLWLNDLLNAIEFQKGMDGNTQAQFVMQTLNRFLSSADSSITIDHVPTNIGQNMPSQKLRKKFAEEATKVWKKMFEYPDKKGNFKDQNIPMTHDGYLKLWQLSKPVLSRYDVILIDEAQDLNPAMLDIIANQPQPRIFVGDSHQQIYSFRGAISAMEMSTTSMKCNSIRTFYLTQSFRFGPEISFVAQTVLELLKNEKKKILVGNGIPCGVMGDSVGQLAILARTNLQVFNELVRLVNDDNNVRIAVVGGLGKLDLQTILDVNTLAKGGDPEEMNENIQSNYIRRFIGKGVDELQKHAEGTYDHELVGKIKIAKKYANNETLKSLIAKMWSRCTNDITFADVVLSTAHKAKGLEFDTVRLTDDFLQDTDAGEWGTAVAILFGSPFVYGSAFGGILGATASVLSRRYDSDEVNLLYVAITRAKKRLQMSPKLSQQLSLALPFHYLVPTNSLPTRNITINPGIPASSLALSLVQRTARTTHPLNPADAIEKDIVIPADIICERHPSIELLAGTIKTVA